MIQQIAFLLSIASAVDLRKFIIEINELITGANLNPNDILDVSMNGYVAVSDLPLNASSETRRVWYEAMDRGLFQKIVSAHFGESVTALFSSNIAELSPSTQNLTVSVKSLNKSEIVKRSGSPTGRYYAFAQKLALCHSAIGGLYDIAGHCANLPEYLAKTVSYLNDDESNQHVSLYSKQNCYHRVLHAWVDAWQYHCFQGKEYSSVWTDWPGSNAPNR